MNLFRCFTEELSGIFIARKIRYAVLWALFLLFYFYFHLASEPSIWSSSRRKIKRWEVQNIRVENNNAKNESRDQGWGHTETQLRFLLRLFSFCFSTQEALAIATVAVRHRRKEWKPIQQRRGTQRGNGRKKNYSTSRAILLVCATETHAKFHFFSSFFLSSPLYPKPPSPILKRIPDQYNLNPSRPHPDSCKSPQQIRGAKKGIFQRALGGVSWSYLLARKEEMEEITSHCFVLDGLREESNKKRQSSVSNFSRDDFTILLEGVRDIRRRKEMEGRDKRM